MRRAGGGFELDGLIGTSGRVMHNGETIAAPWSLAIDGASARTGNSGMHISRAAVSGFVNAGAYRTLDTVSGFPRWGATPNAAQIDLPWLGTAATSPKRVWIRMYHQPVVINAHGTQNVFFMLDVRDSSNRQWAGLSLRSSPASYALYSSDQARIIGIYAPSVGTWYRLEMMIEIEPIYSTTFDYHTNIWVYAATGITPLGFASFSAIGNSAGSLGNATQIHMGYKAIGLQQAVAQEGYLDDWAINDDLIAAGQSGIHVQSPWGGACRNVFSPNGAGSNAAWSIGGTTPAATNWQGVDDWPPNDGTDLNFTPAAVGTPKDSHAFANPTFPGLEITKALHVVARSQDLVGGSPIYKMGVLENATDLEMDNNFTGGWQYLCAAVGEVGGGGAWNNTKANGAELMYRKTTSDAASQQEVSAIAVEVEDNDGLVAPLALPAKRGGKGGVY